MNRSPITIGSWVLLLLGAVGCTEPAGPVPGQLYSGYDLRMIDSQFLPVEVTPGRLLLANGLAFGAIRRPRSDGGGTGLVAYVTLIRQGNQNAVREVVHLNYAVDADEVRIDLCPPASNCLVPTELIGSVVAGGNELILTHFLNGQAGPVYHYFPALAE